MPAMSGMSAADLEREFGKIAGRRVDVALIGDQDGYQVAILDGPPGTALPAAWRVAAGVVDSHRIAGRSGFSLVVDEIGGAVFVTTSLR